VVFGGFASDQLAQRIDHSHPKVVISASFGLAGTKVIPYKPLLDAAIDLSKHKPQHVIVYNVQQWSSSLLSLYICKIVFTFQREPHPCSLVPGRDLDWATVMATAKPATYVPVESSHPLYILYTSGTTGTPMLHETAPSIIICGHL